MIKVIRVCRKCGAKIFSDSPKGLCTACALETALGISESVAGVADPDEGDKFPRDDVATACAATMLGELGDYELLEEIGRGGQGVVFRARQKSLNRTVALKIIGLGQWASKAHVKRFRLEAEAAARLDHPCIVPIYEVGEREGSCYFSMKFIDGGQLDEVTEHKPISARTATELIAKVARTVHYAHEHHILHRDIKPGNILLDRQGEPHLTDFGLARLVETESTVTRTMEVLGTPSYMAPEQAVGNNAAISSVTDVYGLGAVLYQLLTGQPPFAGGTTYETIKLLLDIEPRQPRLLNPKIDRDLSTICLKCLEKDPKRRYSSALALAEDLEHWLKHEPIHAKRSGVFAHTRKWVRRNPSTTVLVTSLLALGVGLSVTIWNRKPPVLIQKTIAALPFGTVSSHPDSDHYLADGLQEDIVMRLARVANLKVVSPILTHRYTSKPRNLSEIAKHLSVANILQGSVQKSAGRLRVSVQLIDAQTDSRLWAETYDRKATDIVGIESEVAKRITKSLQAKLTGREEQAFAVEPTNNSEAYEAYLRGLSFAQDRFGASRDDALKAATWFERAVQLDPNFAIAWARLSRMHANLCLVGGPEAISARRDAAKMALDNAQKLAPNSTETLLALGYYQYWALHDWEAAKTTFGRITKMVPGNSEIPWAFGLITRPEGNLIWIFNPANGHEYRLTAGYYWGVSDTAGRTRPDWFDAEDEAVASGGHLVTINDEAEKNWLVSLFIPGDPFFGPWGACLWIGLSDFGSEGSFYWISGETATFTSWDSGQPDNAHVLGEDSVHTNHFGGLGLWNDLGPKDNSPYHPSAYHGIIE